MTAEQVRLRADYAGRACDALRQAVRHGYGDAVSIETEPDLDPVRDQPAFKTVLADLTRSPAK